MKMLEIKGGNPLTGTYTTNYNINSTINLPTATQDGYRYGYINYRGKVILKPEYTELERVTEIADEKELYLIAFKEGQAGLIKNKKALFRAFFNSLLNLYYFLNFLLIFPLLFVLLPLIFHIFHQLCDIL